MNRSKDVPDGFEICVQGAKDWLAHRKFLKESGLEFEDEIERKRYPKGAWGWIRWRAQFAPAPGQDLSLIETTLGNLHEQHKLNHDECTRLRALYGLDSDRQFCVGCGTIISADMKFCVKCGHPTYSEEVHPPGQGAAFKPKE
jgi:hypothetical protein